MQLITKELLAYLKEFSAILKQQVRFHLVFTMHFIKAWANCVWISFGEGSNCQVLSKKGERNHISLTEQHNNTIQERAKQCLSHKLCHTIMNNKLLVTCDLSFEHNCDLCSELLGISSRLLLRGSLLPMVLFFHRL